MLSHFSRVGLSAPLWIIAHQAPLCMHSSGNEYWSGLLCPPPEGFLTQWLNLQPLHCRHALYPEPPGKPILEDMPP